jgi:hypothetical protein
MLLLFFSSAGKPTFLFLISARKSTISNLTFCQKVYHLYSLFLSENLLFPILLSARKCIISILCFCQKIYYFHSHSLPESVSFLFFVSVRKSLFIINDDEHF